MTWTVDPMMVVAGAVTGLVVGLTGVGGGAVMTPLLLLVFGVTPLAAVGTDLWFAAFTKLFASRVHHRHGLIDWQIARWLWLGSLSSSALTLLFLKSWRGALQGLDFLKVLIAAAVLITSIAMLVQTWTHMRIWRQAADPIASESTLKAMTVGCGALLGLLVTITSVGAGALGALFLVYLYPVRLTPPRLIATDIVHAIPLAMFAGAGHLLLGSVDFSILGDLLIGSIPAAVVGATLSSRLPHQVLRTSVAVVLLLIGLKLAWTTF